MPFRERFVIGVSVAVKSLWTPSQSIIEDAVAKYKRKSG